MKVVSVGQKDDGREDGGKKELHVVKEGMQKGICSDEP